MFNILKFNKKPSSEYQDLTQHEIRALTFKYNLADAHTHQSQSPSQREIVTHLPELWYKAERKTQVELEEKFIETFFRSQRQNAALETPSMLVYTSSIAMVITAKYLMKKKLSVSLMHPCFDNLHDILRHMQINVKPLAEELFYDPDKIYENLKSSIKTDAIFLVDPNNPTGFTLTGTANNEMRRSVVFSNFLDMQRIIINC